MQLVIKLFNNKFPKIGIVYPTEYQAGKALETIVDSHKDDKFRATIEVLNGSATLTLSSINGSARIVYKTCEFKIEQLKQLQAFVKSDSQIHFVHVYWKGNTLYQAKVRFKNPAPIVIYEYEII
jgi:hypothetical protein